MANMAYQVFVDLDATALEGGAVYLGQADADPEQIPIPVFWDAALTIAAVQPLRTSGGVIVRDGTPADVFAAVEAYSIRVRNRAGSIVWYKPTTGGVSASRLTFPIPTGPAGADSTVPGPANNTYTSYAALQASDPTRKYSYLAGDTDNPPRADGPYVNTTGAVGAWVPQPAAGITHKRAEASAVPATVASVLAETVSVTRWGAFPDNIDHGVQLQKALDEAPLGCNLVFPAPPTPDFEYRTSVRLNVRRKMNLIGHGARLIRYGAGSADDAANDLLYITPAGFDIDARNMRIEGFRNIGFNGGGRHAIRLANDGGNIAQIGFVIRSNTIAGGAGGYAIRLDAGQYFGTHVGTIIDNQIFEGIYHAAADSMTFARNNFGGIKGIVLDLVPGAFVTRIRDNTGSPRDGWLTILNGDQIEVSGNHIEQAGVNQSQYKSQVLISGQKPDAPVRDVWFHHNNWGGGDNTEAPFVLAGNCRDVRIDHDVIRRGNLNGRYKDVRILSTTCKGTVFGPDNSARGGQRGTVDAGWPFSIEDGGEATRGVWREMTNGDLSAGWTVAAGGFRWMVDVAGFVHFDGGLVAGGVTGNAIVFVLPIGARPRATRLLSAAGSSGPAIFTADANGNVSIKSGTAGDSVYLPSFRSLIRTAYEPGVV